MQTDSHYFATYVLARAAGLRRDVAQTIANCSEFVDDNVAEIAVETRDGGRVDAEATAHHPIDTENLEAHDQRQVWVPFHFLPGNQGSSYTERLKCRKNSPIAREMIAHHLELADQPFAVSLIGVAAHVYADTFSHYGFSGVSSRGNKIVNDSIEFSEDLSPEMRNYITDKYRAFKRKHRGGVLVNIKSWLGETGSLGHGAVATYPDRPYLQWSFEYESLDCVEGRRSDRDNRKTFFEAFTNIHAMFREFAKRRPDLTDPRGGCDFDDIAKQVRHIVNVQAPCEGRSTAWQAALGSGLLHVGAEPIPAYLGYEWNKMWAQLQGADDCNCVHDHAVWRFYQASAVHRTYVLRELLPHHGLIVD